MSGLSRVPNCPRACAIEVRDKALCAIHSSAERFRAAAQEAVEHSAESIRAARDKAAEAVEHSAESAGDSVFLHHF